MNFGRRCTPLGGAASGLWPAKSAQQTGPLGALGPSPSGSPPPSPTCITPTIFADCFGSCSGVISGAAPGPVCGWTFIEPFGPLAGRFTLSAGVMSMDTATDTEFPIAAKSFAGALSSVNGLTGRFSFTEYLSTPNLNTTYELTVENNSLSEALLVAFFGDGSIAVQVGDPANVAFYTGAWTPVPGASHTVHFATSALGVPTLYLDGVAIPLTLMGNVPSFLDLFPANSVTMGGGSGDPAAGSSRLSTVFLTSQAVGPAAVFCCPT